MKRLPKHLLLLFAVAALSSCSPPDIDVEVVRIGREFRVTLSQDWGLVFRRNQIPCVREAGLYVPGTYGRNAAAWLVEAPEDVQCLDLAAFTIGRTPKGFAQTRPLQTIPGEIYTIRVGGIGWGEKDVKF